MDNTGAWLLKHNPVEDTAHNQDIPPTPIRSTESTFGMSLMKTEENVCMIQGFEWYVPEDQEHWTRLASSLEGLKTLGINNIWIPPACKAGGLHSNGYDPYDLYDLGEFDQKGARSTKWGLKEDLMKLVAKAKEVGVGLYLDMVLNHKGNGDRTEKCIAVEVDDYDRYKDITSPYEIEAWLAFDYEGRGDKYSSQKYHWYHFSGIDYNAANGKCAIYRIIGDGNKYWSEGVDKEKGNYDYLMWADVDFSHPEVKEDVFRFGEWAVKELSLQGIRFDAIKHFDEEFLRSFINHLDWKFGSSLFYVGEYWSYNVDTLTRYLDKMGRKFSLFDSTLVASFSRISTSERADLRQVFDRTLVQYMPVNAVTLLMNHDTQPYQCLEIRIEPWFIPLGYALILLRVDGYPCVFYGHLYGIKGYHSFEPSCGGKLPDLCLTRKLYSYGKQNDYFDSPHCIGWTREGTWDKPFGLACIMSNAGPGEKRMYVGEEHGGEVWTDILGWEQRQVTIGEDGLGMFTCHGVSVAVFVKKNALGRDQFGKFDADIYKERQVQ